MRLVCPRICPRMCPRENISQPVAGREKGPLTRSGDISGDTSAAKKYFGWPRLARAVKAGGAEAGHVWPAVPRGPGPGRMTRWCCRRAGTGRPGSACLACPRSCPRMCPRTGVQLCDYPNSPTGRELRGFAGTGTGWGSGGFYVSVVRRLGGSGKAAMEWWGERGDLSGLRRPGGGTRMPPARSS